MAQAHTLAEAESAFRADVADRAETLVAFVDTDIQTLDAIAAVIAKAAGDIEALYAKLDGPAKAKGATFKASDLDEYAAVEGLLWDKLAGSAERFVKAALRASLSARVV